jgi:hypothetical protein
MCFTPVDTRTPHRASLASHHTRQSSPARPRPYFFSSLSLCATFKPSTLESRKTLFLLFCNIAATLFALSNSLRSTYALLFLIASPINSALRASPCARTTVACFSWRALSTTKAARWASCCATCLASTAAVNSGEKARC